MEIFYGGDFFTGFGKDINSVAINSDIIIDTGKFEDLKVRYPNARLNNINGGCMLPGFIDGHSHITAVAYSFLFVNLKPSPEGCCNSIEDMLETLRKKMSGENFDENKFLIGIGYDNSVFKDSSHPSYKQLDDISREIPIAVIHISGHICALNSRAMKILKVNNDILSENDFFAVADKMCRISSEDMLNAISKASKLYASYGITTAQDAKITKEDFELLCTADSTGLLLNDVFAYANTENYEKIDTGSQHVRLAGCKLFLDGSPQGKTAWLTKPYKKAPDNKPDNWCGEPIYNDEELIKIMKKYLERKVQLNIHANGDAAIDQLLRCYAEAFTDCHCTPDLRTVIIHCQTVREDQLDKIRALKILISYFANHVYYWGDYHVNSVLGRNRAEKISPLNSTLERHIPFTIHTDSPVVPPNIIFSIHNAVNRITKNGIILGKDERITAEQAIISETFNGAYQLFCEKYRGSIEIGKLADFVILDKNPIKVQPSSIKQIKVIKTIKRGKIIYDCQL